MAFPGMRAAHISVSAFDTMHQPLLDQELQSSIDRWRHGALPLFCQLLKQFVGAYGCVTAPDQFKDTASNRSQTHPPFIAKALRLAESHFDATAMVVIAV